MVIDPSSGYNKGGINTANTGSGKVKATTTPTTNAPASPAGKSDDSVSLSSKAHTLSRLETAMADLPDVNEAKVAALKQAVDSGTYEINPRSIAEKMLAQDQDF